MDKYFLQVKIILSTVLSFITAHLGGYDSVLSLLVLLILSDLITGVIFAIMQKKLSSTELRNGLLRKFVIFLFILVAYKVDLCIIDFNGSPISIGSVDLSIRTLFIVYSCLEECISLIENLANIGVPFPKWLKDILIQVSDYVNDSAPKELLNWIKKILANKLGYKVKDDNDKK